MTRTAISVDHIARVEGHGNVHLSIKDGAVETCEMNVVEPARLFESMVVGRKFADVPYIASRVCGICSASHVITDILAIERIFGVEVTDRTRALRELLVYGSYLQNHASHLFVFAAPDFLDMASVFPLAKANPELFDQALGLKSLGNQLCNLVGGRSIHPITAVVGGFTHEPSRDEYLAMADKLDAEREFARAVVDLFNGFAVPDIATQGDMMAMVAEGRYPVADSRWARFLDAGVTFDADRACEQVEEYEVSHSAALFARCRQTGKTYFTGALARINASWGALSQEAKVAAAKAGLRPPERNPFLNNVAQAVEVLDALGRCADLCRKLAEPDGPFEGDSAPVPFEVRAGVGTGFTEAPRGTVFHQLELDDAGRVVHATIMTPTAQNCANLEADIRVLAEKLIADGAEAPEVRVEVEKLVRAYDPCFSCSVH
ncbi:MAG: Ni/Fe hydrogenase subunit alpha [Coriobacteriia bacterium]|nr:Ni/Fe hydrogenase subunit alpha [Coriobacteriia bacterium]